MFIMGEILVEYTIFIVMLSLMEKKYKQINHWNVLATLFMGNWPPISMDFLLFTLNFHITLVSA